MKDNSISQSKSSNTTVFLKERLASLDVLRGIAIALMILVNSPGGDAFYDFLQHPSWNGWTLADLVFPLFIFTVGVAIPFAFTSKLEKGTSRRKLLIRIAQRIIILFILGIFISNFPFGFDPATFRIMGVLQRIALCYLFASLIFLYLKPKWHMVLTFAIPVVYWMLMTLMPVPGYGPGVLTENGNLSGYIDRLLLGKHIYSFTGTFDPEGLLSTLPAVGTALIGVLAGQYLRSNIKPNAKTVKLLLLGSFSLAMGLLWSFWFPINKNLWSSSYVAFTGGIAIIILATCYFIIDVKRHITLSKPFSILGLNAIFVYALSEIINLTLIYTNIQVSETLNISLKSWIYENLFASWAGPLHGSFIYALAFLAFCWAVAAILYWKKIYIKV